MEQYKTQLGYIVKETIDGLDVYEDEKFVCELTGHTLNDYRYNGKINDDILECAIKEEIEVIEFLDKMKGL
jgi:hypothetical protein